MVVFRWLCYVFIDYKIAWISRIGIWELLFWTVNFDRGFRSGLQTELYQIFGRFSRVRIFFNYISNRSSWVPFFSNELYIIMPWGFLIGFWETETHLRTRGCCHVSTFGSRRDNFIGIKVINFLNHLFVFISLVDIGCVPIIVYLICETEQLSLFVDKMNIPPRKGFNRLCRAPLVPPQEKSQVQPKFQALLMPQPGFFPIMPPAFQGLCQFLVCTSSSPSPSRAGSVSDTTPDNNCATSSTVGYKAFQVDQGS